MYYVICPLGRPSDIDNVILQWERQTARGRDAQLVVVENGDAVGACKDAGFRPRAVLESRKHPGDAKNVGIDFAMDQGGDGFLTFDSDDTYTERYVEETLDLFRAGHWVVGKSESFVRVMDGRLVLMRLHGGNRPVSYVQGPTIAARFWHRMPFFDVEWTADGSAAAGEDAGWCEMVRESGRQIWASSRYHWCYMRSSSGQHVYRADDRQLLGMSGKFGESRPAPPVSVDREWREDMRLSTLTPAAYLDRMHPGVELFDVASSDVDAVVSKMAGPVPMTPLSTPEIDLIRDNHVLTRPSG